MVRILPKWRRLHHDEYFPKQGILCLTVNADSKSETCRLLYISQVFVFFLKGCIFD
jgi:hypothetical protein